MENISSNSAITPPAQPAGGGSDVDAAITAAMEQIVAAALMPQIGQLMSATSIK